MPETKRILVVDDEKVIADTLVLIMQRHGFSALACYDGREAVERARTFCPDLLLADYDLPSLDGFRAAAEVKAIQPRCQIVFLSALPDFAFLSDLGSLARMERSDLEYSWINKPVSPRALLSHLEVTFLQAA